MGLDTALTAQRTPATAGLACGEHASTAHCRHRLDINRDSDLIDLLGGHVHLGIAPVDAGSQEQVEQVAVDMTILLEER